MTFGTQPQQPLWASLSPAEIARDLCAGRVSHDDLTRDVQGCKAYWVKPASRDAIAEQYRLLKSVKGVGDIAPAEVVHIIRTFCDDAERHELSLGELLEGMACYRDHGGPFLPRAFGDWKAAQEGRIYITGQERHRRYSEVVTGLKRGQRTSRAASETVDLQDMADRLKAAKRLHHLARKHSGRARYKLTAVPCVLNDLVSQLGRIEAIPAPERTEFEGEQIAYANRSIATYDKTRGRSGI